jgi:ribonuclease HIII
MENCSHIPPIAAAIQQAQTPLLREGIFIKKQKDIPYGTLFEVEGQDSTAKITLYHSKKKGLSAVDNSKSPLSRTALDYILQRKAVQFRPCIGTDEAGKGDLFGPLVCCGFFVETSAMADELRDLGVMDSKRLKDDKIAAIAQKLQKRWPRHYSLVAPKMETYNQLYKNIQNLNKLLGWMHGRVIADLYEEFRKENVHIPCAVADKFGPVEHIINSVGGLDSIAITAETRGEEKEISIAAASIIARSVFVRKIHALSREYGMSFPLGCADRVIPVAQKYCETHGYNTIFKVLKTHFKTVKKLQRT